MKYIAFFKQQNIEGGHRDAMPIIIIIVIDDEEEVLNENLC